MEPLLEELIPPPKKQDGKDDNPKAVLNFVPPGIRIETVRLSNLFALR
jgi:hypothetical protein